MSCGSEIWCYIVEKTFRQKVREFLDEHFGSILAENYVRMVMRELKIKDLDKATEKEKEKFIYTLVKRIYSKMMSEQDLKKQTYLVFYKVFGSQKAMEAFGKTDITIQPITFLYFVFGKIFGEYVLEQGENLYGIKEIKKQDEFEQVKFVKRLLNDIFIEFPEHYRKEIDLRFLIFLKFGESKEKDLLRFLNSILSSDNYLASLNLMESIVSFFNQDGSKMRLPTDVEISDMVDKLGIEGDDKQLLLNSLKGKIEELSLKDGSSGGTKKNDFIAGVKKVLTSVVGSSVADSMINEVEKSLGVKKIDDTDVSKKRMFIDHLLASDPLSRQSFQKRLIVEDKLKSLI